MNGGGALIVAPALARAAVVGVFGAAALALITIYSRRGPMIFPVYAAILAALALLLTRFPALSLADRLAACLVSFCVASAGLYVASGILAQRHRQHAVARGQLPPSALHFRISFAGHAWRWAVLLSIGVVVSAGVAFIAG